MDITIRLALRNAVSKMLLLVGTYVFKHFYFLFYFNKICICGEANINWHIIYIYNNLLENDVHLSKIRLDVPYNRPFDSLLANVFKWNPNVRTELPGNLDCRQINLTSIKRSFTVAYYAQLINTVRVHEYTDDPTGEIKVLIYVWSSSILAVRQMNLTQWIHRSISEIIRDGCSAKKKFR